jgi:hypothetical protein
MPTKKIALSKRKSIAANITRRRASGYGALKDLMKLDEEIDVTAPTGVEFDPDRVIPAER